MACLKLEIFEEIICQGRVHDVVHGSQLTHYNLMRSSFFSGAQGEYAGLMAIKAYHDSRGDSNRTVGSAVFNTLP